MISHFYLETWKKHQKADRMRVSLVLNRTEVNVYFDFLHDLLERDIQPGRVLAKNGTYCNLYRKR